MSVAARRSSRSPGPAGRLDRTLAALADPHRRAVVEILRQGPASAGDLARSVGLPAPAMSRHLRTLRESGLVEPSSPAFDARLRVYALNPGPVGEVMAWLEETERMWSVQLAAFKAHLESAPAAGDEGS